MANYRGEKASGFFLNDYLFKTVVPQMFSPEDKKEELTKALLDKHIPEMLSTLSKHCIGNSKFLCGETVTIHDMVVAGGILNSIANPNGRLGQPGLDAWAAAPENVKTYVANFSEVMKEYLDSRPQSCTF